MDVNIDQAGKAVASIVSAVARVLPIIRRWRTTPQSQPEELKTVSESIDQIQDGLSCQQQIAYLFRPLITNYGYGSELLSLIDKLLEFCKENESVLNQSSDLGKSLRKSLKTMIDDIAGYDITILKRILDDSVHFLREKDKQVLKKAASAINSDLAAIKSVTARDDWQLDTLRDHLTKMKLCALDLKTELQWSLYLLVDVLAFTKF